MRRINGRDEMKDKHKTKDQLVNELKSLREKTAKLDTSGVKHKETEGAPQTSKDDMIRSDRLAFTGRIAANIAHEIRNPLTNVALSAQQLEKSIKSKDPIITEYIGMIRRNTERANYLITELLNSARPPKLNLQSCNIHKVLEDILESNKTKISSRKIKIIRKFASATFIIKIDKEQMRRAFLNIVLNAVEAVPKRGKLTIITEFKENLFVVKIQDTGKGIFEEDIIRIFDPFFSSKSKGVGLGLTICYGIVVSHRGTIEVKSKPKKGTVFTISLPVK